MSKVECSWVVFVPIERFQPSQIFLNKLAAKLEMFSIDKHTSLLDLMAKKSFKAMTPGNNVFKKIVRYLPILQ